MKRSLTTVLSLVGIALAVPANSQTVAFATLPPGAINNVQAQVISKVIQQNTDLQLRVITFRGTAAVSAAVNSGRAEIGISDLNDTMTALNGTHVYKGKPQPNLRIVFRAFDFPIGIFVRKDSGITKVSQMKGKKFPVGWTAFPNAIPLANGVLASAGLSLDDVDGVPATNIIRAANDVKSGKTVGSMFAVGAPKIAEVNSAVGVRFLSIDNSAAALARIKKIRPNYFIMTLHPAPHFAGIEGPTNVIGVDNIIFSATHVSDDVIYKFVKAAHANKAEFVKGHPSFNRFNPAGMAKQFSGGLKYHPGAIKFFKEKGMWPSG